MTAEEFNTQVDGTLSPILEGSGFIKYKSSFIRTKGNNQLVLLRFSTKYSSIQQSTNFMLCFRHTFLRDVWEKIPEPIPKENSGFPFFIKPSELESKTWQKWKYQFELNITEYDTIKFGEIIDAQSILRNMGEAVCENGIKWAGQFSEGTALKLLTQSKSPMFVENLWIEDYQNN